MPITKARLKISDYNKNRKTRLQSQERRVRMVSLSLTSMVDMFAILVIFLLASSSSFVEWLRVEHGIQLPKAKTAEMPRKAATLHVATDGIYGDNRLIITIAQAQNSVEPLRRWLSHLEKRDGYINVLAHQKLPFGVVKRVIAACQDAGFGNVNLAVQPRG